MTSTYLAMVIAGWTLVLATGLPLQAQESSGERIGATVKMTTDLSYSPERVAVRPGETVVWKNTSPVVHTVTADPGRAKADDSVALPDGAEPFDSGAVPPGGEYRRTFTVPGTYRYFSVPHEASGMIGEIVVKGAGGK